MTTFTATLIVVAVTCTFSAVVLPTFAQTGTGSQGQEEPSKESKVQTGPFLSLTQDFRHLMSPYFLQTNSVRLLWKLTKTITSLSTFSIWKHLMVTDTHLLLMRPTKLTWI
jgi:hypothetical protein